MHAWLDSHNIHMWLGRVGILSKGGTSLVRYGRGFIYVVPRLYKNGIILYLSSFICVLLRKQALQLKRQFVNIYVRISAAIK